MTTLLTNYSLDNIIEEFKKPRECDEVSVDEMLSYEAKDLHIMLKYGWPYQDVMVTEEGEYTGIPINLAKVVIVVCEFCAKHNIDLSNAMGLLLNKE